MKARPVMNFLYHTPAGFDDLLLTGDVNALTGLLFITGARDSGEASPSCEASPLWLGETVRWLDLYFQGRDPGFLPPYSLTGLTPFQERISERILRIPYGKTLTYGEIAEELAAERGIARMSARAVGRAVGRNPLCVLIPCHRVLGAGGRITGYSGGLQNKRALLTLEGISFR